MRELLKNITDDKIRKFAEEYIKIIPDYFWRIPASSSGKYHPEYTLGDGGLYRHTVAACKILEDLMVVTKHFSDEEKDIMRVAMMFHDTFKSGSQTEYEVSKNTKFEHPLIAADKVRELGEKLGIVSESIYEEIAQCIESHMGQWNTSNYSSVILPEPLTKNERLVHIADYLASRKHIEVKGL